MTPERAIPHEEHHMQPDTNVLTDVLIDLLTRLTAYIVQLEHPDPDQLLNPVHLRPGRDETWADVEHRNEALRDEALGVLAALGHPVHTDMPPS